MYMEAVLAFSRTNISTQTVWQLWPTCLHSSQVSILMWPREWSGRVCVLTFDWSVRLMMSLVIGKYDFTDVTFFSEVSVCSYLQMKH